MSHRDDTSLTGRILAAHALGPAVPGSAFLTLDVDVILGHEATIALLIERMRRAGLHIRNPERCLFAADHFVPPATAERASILQKYIEFLVEQGVSDRYLFKGISHQLMVEDARCVPGALICGADSHTTMGGALGAFAAGYGSTDILSILVTGQVREAVPTAIGIQVSGALPSQVGPKDLALWMMKTFGEGGATGCSLEWQDRDQTLPVGARATVCNMAVDCGARNALWLPDEQTRRYLLQRDGRLPPDFELWQAAGLPQYAKSIQLELTTLSPLVARPGSPADVCTVAEARGAGPGEKVHQVVIGSCTSGDGQDIRDAATLLKGHRVASGVRLVITPASQAVYRALIQEGVITDLIDAGALITAPACGACGGIDKGILGAGEVCVSTSNRNFRGRMGHPDARVYLSAGRVAAATAITGRLTDPREIAVN